MAGHLPDVVLETLQGESIALCDPAVTARIVIVYRHDCALSREVLPVIERVSRAFHGKRLVTLGLSLGSADDTLDAIIEHGLCFPQAVDAGHAVATALRIDVLPTVVLTASDGAVLARCDGRDGAALVDVLVHAARLSGADEIEVRRTAEAFALPTERAASNVPPRPA